MNHLPKNPTLRDINAYKKSLNWGELPPVYRLAANAVSDLDGIVTHGFDNAYKSLSNKKNWNLALLDGYVDDKNEVQVNKKPRIALRHVFSEETYELHCFPVVNNEKVRSTLINHSGCPFVNWTPETMQVIIRLNAFVSFIVFTFRKGDIADMSLIKYAHLRVEELILKLRESFDITDIIGYNIAEFCQEIDRRKSEADVQELFD